MKVLPAKVRSPGPFPIWNLWLYVAGPTPTSVTAFRNLKRICEEHLAGRYHIQVVDLVKNPQLARENQILAMPAVVRKDPSPARRVLGDLSDTKRVLAALDLPLHALLPFDSRRRRITNSK